MPRNRRTRLRSRRNVLRRLVGLESLESRRLLACIATGTDTNDQMCEATSVIRPGVPKTNFSIGSTTDADLFILNVVETARTYTIETDTDRLGSDLDTYLRVFDDTGLELAEDDDIGIGAPGNNSDSRINFTFPAAGRYYIGVSSFDNENYNPITGDDDTTGDTTGGYDLIVEDNNDQDSEAVPLAFGQRRGGFSVNPDTDVDVFEVTPIVSGMTARFEFDAIGGFHGFLRLFDDSGNLITTRTPNAGQDATLTHMFTNSDPVYLGVSGSGNSGYDVEDGDGDTAGDTGSFAVSVFDLGLHVTTNADRVSSADGETSLREAVTLANSASRPGPSTITFASSLTGNPVQVTASGGGHLLVSDDLTIQGRGADQLTISGQTNSRIFQVASGTTFTVEDVTLKDAQATGDGGAINGLNLSTIIVRGSEFVSNFASQEGSAISSLSFVDIADSTFVDNSGVAVRIEGARSGDEGKITNSTFDDPIRIKLGTVTVLNSTFRANIGIRSFGNSRLKIGNSILTTALNDNSSGNAFFTSLGHNLATGSPSFLNQPGDLTNTDPLLEPLALNGGGTRTYALQPTSPAIDAALKPIAEFDFEGNADDEFGGHNGTLQGGLIVNAPGAPDISDTAVEFTGDGTQYIQLANPLTIGNKSNTVEAWVKIPKIGGGDLTAGERVGPILASYPSSPNANWEIHDDGELRVFWNNGQRDVRGVTDLRDNQWHHIAFVRDTTANQFRFYVDGVQDAVFSNAGSNIDFGSPHRIGQDNRTGTPIPFHGTIDNLAIHDRALTVEELSSRQLLFDGRGDPFQRVVDGNGGAAVMDIGAVEQIPGPPETPGLVVTTVADTINPFDQQTSLREAIEHANEQSGLDTISFDPTVFATPQTIVTERELGISDSVTITGPGADLLAISGNNQDHRVLLISDGNTGNNLDVSISGLTIRDGGDGITPLFGAGILSRENLSLSGVAIVDNHGGSTGDGGGLNFSNASLTIANSTISGNQGDIGGGIRLESSAVSATIVNSTISGNLASASTGGLSVNGTTIVVTVTNSTITGNQADSDNNGSGDFGGVFAEPSSNTLRIYNTIVAGNGIGAAMTPSDAAPNSFFTFSTNNLIGHRFSSGGLADGQSSNIVGETATGIIPIAAILNPVLADNGGTTLTHELTQISPAIDAGSNFRAGNSPVPLLLDQRGFDRIIDAGGGAVPTVDMGAVEAGLVMQDNPLIVDTTTDTVDGDVSTGQLSLREAIAIANIRDGLDEITFNLPDHSVITLGGTALPKIDESITITGPGADELAISGNDTSGILHFKSFDDPSATYTIQDVTLKDAKTTANATQGPVGAISVIGSTTGTLIIERVVISDNSAETGAGVNVSFSNYLVRDSSFVGNTGIESSAFRAISADGWIINSTLSGNTTTASNEAGAILNLTGPSRSSAMRLMNVTVVGSSKLGVRNASNSGPATVEITNSIFADNAAGNVFDQSGTAFTSHGFNLSDDASAGFTGPIDQTSTDPLLGFFGNNGGTTPTYALQPTSPAIDRGNSALAVDHNGQPLTSDQRGAPFLRNVGGVDIGAFEVHPVDFGDAPQSFGTTIADGGASHLAVGPRLGTLRDGELDGAVSPLADGDDTSGIDDDDGVLFGRIASGAGSGVNVDLQNTANAKVDAWIDFNRNGVWDASEKILDNAAVVSGLQTLNYNVPVGATSGVAIARVRVSTIGGLGPNGEATDGEVEDYAVTIGSVAGVASATINQGRNTRSEITSIEVQFESVVNAVASDFLLNDATGQSVTGIVVANDNSGPTTLSKLTFTMGNGILTRSETGVLPTLADGTYQLRYRPTVLDRSDSPIVIDHFFRKYGETEATSATVGLTDFAAFRSTFGKELDDAGFRSDLDANRDGAISLTDFASFRSAFGN